MFKQKEFFLFLSTICSIVFSSSLCMHNQELKCSFEITNSHFKKNDNYQKILKSLFDNYHWVNIDHEKKHEYVLDLVPFERLIDYTTQGGLPAHTEHYTCRTNIVGNQAYFNAPSLFDLSLQKLLAINSTIVEKEHYAYRAYNHKKLAATLIKTGLVERILEVSTLPLEVKISLEHQNVVLKKIKKSKKVHSLLKLVRNDTMKEITDTYFAESFDSLQSALKTGDVREFEHNIMSMLTLRTLHDLPYRGDSDYESKPSDSSSFSTNVQNILGHFYHPTSFRALSEYPKQLIYFKQIFNLSSQAQNETEKKLFSAPLKIFSKRALKVFATTGVCVILHSLFREHFTPLEAFALANISCTYATFFTPLFNCSKRKKDNLLILKKSQYLKGYLEGLTENDIIKKEDTIKKIESEKIKKGIKCYASKSSVASVFSMTYTYVCFTELIRLSYEIFKNPQSMQNNIFCISTFGLLSASSIIFGSRLYKVEKKDSAYSKENFKKLTQNWYNKGYNNGTKQLTCLKRIS